MSEENYTRYPGLYRRFDLASLLGDRGDYRIVYAELTDEGEPLFAVYRRPVSGPLVSIRGVAS